MTDQPVSVMRMGNWRTPTFLPHRNWRGHHAGASYADGRIDNGSLNLYDIPWPGDAFDATLNAPPESGNPPWLGSLLVEKTDASGQMYMRNRYFDPQSGRFTQEDPIGLAGGLNLYGFGGGDAVNYSDPYGLAADTLQPVLVTRVSSEVPRTTYGTLCVDSSVRDDVQQIYDVSVSIGIPVNFNNAYRDRNTAGTGGRPAAGGASQHLAGFAFDINSSALTRQQNSEFTRVAGQYGFTPVQGDPGHYQVTGGGASVYGSHSAAKTRLLGVTLLASVTMRTSKP